MNGEKVGSLCVIDNEPRQYFSLVDKQTLMELGLIVSNLISNRYEEFKQSRQQRSRCLLSLTHNLNTMVTGMELPLRALEATATMPEAVSCVDRSLGRLKAMTSALLSLAAQLPAVNAGKNKDPAESISFAGSRCNILDVLAAFQNVAAFAYPNLQLKLPELDRRGTHFYSFVDVFVVSVIKALNNMVDKSSSCKARVYFADNDGNEVLFDSLFNLHALVFDVEVVAHTLKKHVGLFDPNDIAKVSSLPGHVLNQFDASNFTSKTVISVPCWQMLATTSLRSPVSARDKRLNVLVVDDDNVAINVLSPSLLARGCEVTSAHNGREGLATLLKSVELRKPFDLVFVDLLMPLVNGIEMMEQVATNPHLFKQLVFCAMHGVEEQLPQLLLDLNNDLAKYNINRIILKPIDDSTIIELVNYVRSQRH